MEAALLVFGASAHWDKPKPQEPVAEYRAWNPGLGVSLRGDVVISGGVVSNSLGRTSVFVSLGNDGYITKHVGWAVSLMATTGYAYQPIGIPVLGLFYEERRMRLHVACMPEAAVVFLEYRL